MTQTRYHLHTIFSRLSLTRTRLTRNNYRLLTLIFNQTLIRLTSYHVDMRRSFHITTEDALPHFSNDFVVEMPFNYFVGVDNDERGSNISKNIVFSVPINQIPKYLGLVENIHLAHVLIELTLRHLKGILEVSYKFDCALRCVCLILYAIIL